MRKIFGRKVYSNGQWINPLSIPALSIVLFETDVSIIGYSFLADVDDEVVYITKGSAAGGAEGGSVKVGSTYTMPSHRHDATPEASNSHVHTAPAHNHEYDHNHESSGHALTLAETPPHQHSYSYKPQGNYGGGSGAGVINSALVWLSTEVAGGTGPGTSSPHDHGTLLDYEGNVDNANLYFELSPMHTHTLETTFSTTPDTWRPYGRCYTRHQRVAI